MSSVRFEERRPRGSGVHNTEHRLPLDIAMQRIDELEARLDDENKRAKRTAKAVAKVYERGGIVVRTDRDGFKEKIIVTGEPKKNKIDPNSLRGRFVSHVTRHI